MPELPEVETIKRQLPAALKGRRVVAVRVLHPKPVKPLGEKELARMLVGGRFTTFGRRAKVLILNLSNGNSVLVHLKMTGRLLVVPKDGNPHKETEVVLDLDGGKRLFYDDLRRFGWFKAMPTEDVKKYFDDQGYGPEPLDRSFDAKKMALCLRAHPKKRLKQLLMEQTCIAGIGNIYADESLWASGIRPDRRVASVTDAEMRGLHSAIKNVLKRSIAARGTSANDYLDLRGKPGTFYSKLKAYGQDGKKCARRDGGIITKTKLGGRGTHFCPVHQK